jgi:hypothetical protein
MLLSVALASLGYANDTWLFFSYIGGDLAPTHAFGLILLALLLANPFLRLLGRWWKFTGADLAVMLALMTMGSVIAGSGLLWAFPHQIITPIQEQANNPGWQRKDLLSYVPAAMMVERVHEKYARDHGLEKGEHDESWRDAVARQGPAEDLKRLDAEDAREIKGYMTGLARPRERLGFFAVPWRNWASTLTFWFVMLGLNFVVGIASAVVVHRQWSQREHLSYPIVTFSAELIGRDEEGYFNAVFRNRFFWIGFAVALGVLLINGWQAWKPGFVSIPTTVDMRQLAPFFGALPKVPQGGTSLILIFHVYFGAVGLGYFLTSEAAFSLGISGWLYALALAPFFVAGVDVSISHLGGGLPAWMYFGAYVGMGVMVLYLGRRFYLAVAKRAVGLRDRFADVHDNEVWAMRILLAASAAMAALLIWIGLHWLLAVLFVLLTGLLFLMVGRVNAATGLFMVQPHWHPIGVMMALFGGAALGPHALMIIAMLSVVVTVDPRIAAVPLALNALKLGELRGVKCGRLATWMGSAIIVSMIVAVLFTVWLLYDKGHNAMKSGGTDWAVAVSRMPFEILDKGINDLSAADKLEEASTPTTVSRLLGGLKQTLAETAQLKPGLGTAFLAGLALVLVCSYLRLRFPRWPLHPVVFLVWGQRWVTEYAPSFFLAWLLKELIMRYAGQKQYHRAKPLFVGLVAGEVAAALFWGLYGAAYYIVKGVQGPSFLVRP